MKKTVMALLMTVSSIALAVNAGAMEINTVKMNDVSNSVVTVEGTVDSYTNNSLVTLFTTKKDNDETKQHIDVFGVDVSGNFKYDFKFVRESGVYNITLVCGDEKQTVELNYTNPEELKAFIRSLAAGRVEDIFAELEKYQTGLGLDLTPFKTALEKNIAVKRVSEKKTEIGKALDENNLNLISQIVEKAAKEAELINSIKNTLVWSSVHSILENTTDITGIDFGRYNNLTQGQKMYVESAIAGKSFTDADALKKEFDRLVSIAPQEAGGNNGGSTGGSGGGNSRGGNTGIYMGGDNGNYGKDNNSANGSSYFTDVPQSHWAYNEIRDLSDKNIISGKGGNRFDPDAAITREEFVKIIVLGFSYYDDTAESDFEDVGENAWYCKYVASAVKAGIVGGISDKQFGSGENITRQDMAVILYRIAKERGLQFEAANTGFTDFNNISDYARDAVAYMSGAGIINGMDNNCFNPKQQASRAQAARLIYALMGRVEQ